MKKEIDWNEEAFEINQKILVEAEVDYKAFTAEQMIAFDLMSERLAVGLLHGHMFRKLLKKFFSHAHPCPLNEKCPCVVMGGNWNGRCGNCKRRFRKELSK